MIHTEELDAFCEELNETFRTFSVEISAEWVRLYAGLDPTIRVTLSNGKPGPSRLLHGAEVHSVRHFMDSGSRSLCRVIIQGFEAWLKHLGKDSREILGGDAFDALFRD